MINHDDGSGQQYEPIPAEFFQEQCQGYHGPGCDACAAIRLSEEPLPRYQY